MYKELFKEYLIRVVDVLPENSFIVLDNASYHKNLNIDEILEKKSIQLIYLPPYSPELNPIEKIWASTKKRLRKIYRYITEDFFEAMCLALLEYADINYLQVSL